MVLEQKAKKAIKIGKNSSVVPTGDWAADTGLKGKSKCPSEGKGPLPGHTASAATAAAASATSSAIENIDHSTEYPAHLSQLPAQSSLSTLPAIEAISRAPQPAVVTAKASEEELLQEQNHHSDDEDEWDKLPVSSDVNADSSSLPIPPEEDTATLVVSKQPFLPPPALPPPRSTPIMSPRMSKKTMMSPARASFSSFERVPVIPPPVPTNDTSNSGISVQSTPAYSIRQIAQIYRNRGLPAQARPVTLEDYDVNSKARFIIS